MAYIGALVLLCAAVLVVYLQYRRTKPPPSTADVLKGGGFYPIPVPLGWKIIDGTLKIARELVYLVRRERLGDGAPLFAEIDGATSTAGDVE